MTAAAAAVGKMSCQMVSHHFASPAPKPRERVDFFGGNVFRRIRKKSFHSWAPFITPSPFPLPFRTFFFLIDTFYHPPSRRRIGSSSPVRIDEILVLSCADRIQRSLSGLASGVMGRLASCLQHMPVFHAISSMAGDEVPPYSLEMMLQNVWRWAS